ncbi:MAG: c-type cytochrome, partial [Hyphomicrobium sp.]
RLGRCAIYSALNRCPEESRIVRTLQKLAIATLLAVPACARAQEVGDPQAGHEYAKKVCAECHAVERGEKESPYLDLPSFQTVADSAGITERALAVWLTNPHPNMPDFILPQADRDNVIAYIISLKSASR